ncbi:MAG: alpha-amylase family glycosyl hydrolase [Acidimicrobiia bacterium]
MDDLRTGRPDSPPWWRTSVVYQIYPRSFADGNGDGVGDLRGIRDRLDHLVWLGVDAIWLSPIFTSPMADFGYDVADYCDIDPVFGDLAEFDGLLADCHARGIRVMLDWVPNHTSIEHPWFVESRSSRDNPKREWYVWRDLGPDGSPPNNWKAAFAADRPAWTLDPTTGQAYLHCFLPEQPDLNWDNPAVEAAMLDTLRFWLDRGVDGFRMDVVHLIGKDLAVVDPEGAAAHVAHNDIPATHERLRHIRALLDSYDGDRTSVGEVVLLDEAAMATYYGQDDELHLSFNFPFLWAPWDAEKLRRRIDRTLEHLTPRQAWPTWVLSNHDLSRHRERYGGAEAAARQAALLLLTLPGTPFLYQGEELGLVDAVVPPDRVVDPGGRDGCRAPIPWTADDRHGWGDDPWLPFPPEAAERSVERQVADPASIAQLYRRLLAARRASPALHAGGFRWLDAPEDVLAYERVDPVSGDLAWIVINLVVEERQVTLPGAGTIALSTDQREEGRPATGAVGGSIAHVVRPA